MTLKYDQRTRSYYVIQACYGCGKELSIPAECNALTPWAGLCNDCFQIAKVVEPEVYDPNYHVQENKPDRQPVDYPRHEHKPVLEKPSSLLGVIAASVIMGVLVFGPIAIYLWVRQ